MVGLSDVRGVPENTIDHPAATDISHLQTGGIIQEFLSSQPDGTARLDGVLRQIAHDRPGHRRFAGAGFADETNGFTFLDLQVYVRECIHQAFGGLVGERIVEDRECRLRLTGSNLLPRSGPVPSSMAPSRVQAIAKGVAEQVETERNKGRLRGREPRRTRDCGT